MAEYFLCLDAEMFSERIRPSLAESWRQRNFDPCRTLCRDLLSSARDYTQRYHTGEEVTLLERIAASGVSFERTYWRLLVSEVLLFAAVDIPEFQSNAETLCCLLALTDGQHETIARESFAPIQQVLRGSRDLTFGSAVYRPEQAGYNDPGDVARLAAYLAALRPECWTVGDLQKLRDAESDEERADELAFVREWFPILVELYQRAQRKKWVLVIESIY